VNAGEQEIPAVVFNHSSTIFVATHCGVGKKVAGSQSFSFDSTTAAQGLITALTLSQSKIWARTPNGLLLVSAEDGNSWKIATTKPLPLSGSTFASRGDKESLGTFDNFAYMSSSLPSSSNQLTIYNALTDAWSTQTINYPASFPKVGNAESKDGTGNGGRRFVKAYVFPRSGFNDLKVVFNTGQELFESDNIGNDGTVKSWLRLAGANCCGVPAPTDAVHSDIWDVDFAVDGFAAWIAGDGGIYQRLSEDNTVWTTWSNGLHTHHAHTITVLTGEDPRVVYPTQDNGGWNGTSSAGNWNLIAGGDRNWSLGDVANAQRAFTILHSNVGDLTDFKSPVVNFIPECGSITKQMTCGDVFYTPRQFQVIQTPNGEDAGGHLDVMLMLQPPLQFVQNGTVMQVTQGPLAGVTSKTGAPIIIRNRQVENNPNVNQSGYLGWELVRNDLPVGTQGFVVSNAHAAPVLYVYDSFNLYRSTIRAGLPPVWTPLNLGSPSALIIGGTYGPAFTNPFNYRQVFVLRQSGITFCSDVIAGVCSPDDVLTALVTASGKFPLTVFTEGDATGFADFSQMGSAPSPSGTLAHVTFSRDKPERMVAVSPFTGVFYNSGDSKWRDLSPYLPKPLSPAASAAIDGDKVFVALQGRGTYRVDDALDASLACFFQPNAGDPFNLLATIFSSDRAPLAGVPVTVRAINPKSGKEAYFKTEKTDSAGRIFFNVYPPSITSGDVIHLRFSGSGSVASCETSFIHNSRVP